MKSRRFKVEMFVDVPISVDGCTEKQTEKLIEQALSEYDCFVDINNCEKEPLENVHKDFQGNELLFEDDVNDISHFEDPVGFIAPDGKFYGCTENDISLAHVGLSNEIYEAYQDYIHANLSYSIYHNPDYELEICGFIKIRGNRLYYVSAGTDKIFYWTPEQIETVKRYIQTQELKCNKKVGFVKPNTDVVFVSYGSFIQMDKISIMKIFQ